MIGIAADDRMVLELAEAARERDVLGARDVLVAQEQHLVLEQQRADLGEQRVVARGVAEVHVGELGADRAGQRLDADRSACGAGRQPVLAVLMSSPRPCAQTTKIDEPVVLRDSRSRCACAASCRL